MSGKTRSCSKAAFDQAGLSLRVPFAPRLLGACVPPARLANGGMAVSLVLAQPLPSLRCEDHPRACTTIRPQRCSHVSAAVPLCAVYIYWYVRDYYIRPASAEWIYFSFAKGQDGAAPPAPCSTQPPLPLIAVASFVPDLSPRGITCMSQASITTSLQIRLRLCNPPRSPIYTPICRAVSREYTRPYAYPPRGRTLVKFCLHATVPDPIDL